MKLLENKQLGNGMTLTIEDASKVIAGDRCNVKISCLMSIPVNDNWFEGLPDDFKEIRKVKGLIGKDIEYRVDKERRFVDLDDKDDIVEELVAQINGNISSYISSDLFPERLFAKRYGEEMEKLSIVLTEEESEVDDDGPADFSSCFED